MNSEYGAVSPQETEPLNRGHESSVNNGVPVSVSVMAEEPL